MPKTRLGIDSTRAIDDGFGIMSARFFVPLLAGLILFPFSLQAKDLSTIKKEAAQKAANPDADPAAITAAAVEEVKQGGHDSFAHIEVASVVMEATPTSDPQVLAGIAAAGITYLSEDTKPMGLASLWSQAIDKHGRAEGDMDEFMAALEAALQALGVPQAIIDASLALLKDRQGGRGFNDIPIGTGLGGGSGQTNPILTGPPNPLPTPPVPTPNPPVPTPPVPTPTPIPPTPTPEPPVTPTQNL